MKTVMKCLNKFMIVCYDVFQNLGAIVLSVILLTVMSGIVSRYIFNRPFTWTEELCTFLLVYLAYLSAPLATISKEHIVADFFKTLLPKKSEAALSIIIRLAEIVFFVFVCISCIHYIPRRTWTSAVLRIPRAAFYFPILTSTVLMCIIIVIDMLNDFFPGYNLFAQRKETREKEIARKEQEENEALLEKMDALLDEVQAAENAKEKNL